MLRSQTDFLPVHYLRFDILKYDSVDVYGVTVLFMLIYLSYCCVVNVA